MVNRLLLTTATGLLLTGLYAMYAVVMRPVLALPTLSVPPAISTQEMEPPRPVENVRVAQTYLPQQPWAAGAKYHMRSSQAFFFTNDLQPEGDQGRLRVRPFAMAWVWTDKQNVEHAVTLVSESAVVKFSGSLNLPTPDPGRVVQAQLDGRAQVTGPNGLVLDGKRFVFSESAAQIWSDDPVAFAYAGSKGTGDKFQADLIPQEGPPGKDRPHIFGIQNVRLSRNVRLDLALKDRNEPMLLKVKCSGSFDYSIEQQSAVFASDVVAWRQTAPEQFDWISADRLAIQFGVDRDAVREAESRDSSPKQPGSLASYQQVETRLKFRRLQAESTPPAQPDKPRRPVRLHSMKYKLQAWVEQLVYDSEDRILVMRHPTAVKLQQGQSQLQVPELYVRFDEHNQLQSLLGRGTGWFVHRNPTTRAVELAAEWRKHLQQLVDPQTGFDVIELDETASLRRPAQNVALGAERIRVWVDRPPQGGPPNPSVINSDSTNAAAPNIVPISAKADAAPAADSPLGMNASLSAGQFRRLEASRDVVLVSAQLEAKCQLLTAWVDATLTPGENANSQLTDLGGLMSRGDSPAPSQNGPLHGEAKAAPAVVGASTIELRLRPTRTGPPDVADVWLRNSVTVQQEHDDGKPPMRIGATLVHLQNDLTTGQSATLHGRPAILQDSGFRMESPTIFVDRTGNRVKSGGPGLMQIPVKSDLDGKPLQEAQVLDLSWKESMEFDGRLAQFRTGVAAVLGDATMNCERMDVTLQERIDFQKLSAADRTTPRLSLVHCRDEVRFHNVTRDGNKVVEIQHAEVWELSVNQISGELKAQGPGFMQMWRRGQQPRGGLSSPQQARANSPTQLDAADWEYTKVKFDGKMLGNIHRRFSSFHERVEIVHGPVKSPAELVVQDKLPKRGGFLRCDEMEIIQTVTPEEPRGVLELVGRGNADLEGEGYYAKADQIQFNEARKTYIMRGFGRNKAQLWHQRTPGSEGPATELQRIEFNPETKRLRIDGITGGEGAR